MARKPIRNGTLLAMLAAAGVASWNDPLLAEKEPTQMREPLPTDDQIAKLPPDGGPEFNRLIFEKSPYLLQHARNPVDWYPWGDEAFERAKAEDKPIFLSVGYSTCHWCHVMERESFEKDDVAALLNEHFVAIKVDREERPDVDEIYMSATQLLTRHGGWPNSVWLTPDGRPWFAGTYFPPEDMVGRPGFNTLLRELANVWHTRRQQVEQQADQLAAAVKRMSTGGMVSSTTSLSRDLVNDAVRRLHQDFDDRLGGFGGAPKFPPHGALSLLLYEYRQTKDESLLQMATRTLEAMAMGGMHDQIGGGFHRYSTDERWFLPHFEKMLYDNAQLARTYVEAFVITDDKDFRRVAEDTLEWVLREMTDQAGGFYSALDADSEGVEGKFYLWSEEEIVGLLGPEDGRLFCRVYGVEPDGNYTEEATGDRPGTNILYLPRPLEVSARVDGVSADELRARLQPMRQRLREVRDRRIWPHLDDKVLASWNGLMIGSLAHAGRQLDEPQYTAAAERAANFVLTAMRRDGRLLRTYRAGEAKLDGYLDDYAFLADGLLELHETTGNQRWFDDAQALIDHVLTHFQDPQGGFYFTSDDHEELLIRSHDVFDKAIPSGNSVAARVLLELGKRTGEQHYLNAARKTLETSAGLMKDAPRAMESMLLATAAYFEQQPQPMATHPTEERPDAHLGEGPVTIDVFASRREAAPGETFLIAVRLNVADGWHINASKPKQDYLVPTSVSIEPDDAVTIEQTLYPPAEAVTLPFSPEPLSAYRGQVWVKLRLKARQDASQGAWPLKLKIDVQPCDDKSCSAPQAHAIALPFEVGAAGGKLHHAALFADLGMMESSSTTRPDAAGSAGP